MGRPKHWYKTQQGYREIGSWAWNDNKLWSKIEVSLDTEECWTWHGSMSPSGALLGGWKNGVQQMSQARRFVWMSQNNEDAAPYQITMKCGNQSCCNPSHFQLKPNNRREQQW